jgi:hypothetical protein
MLPSTNAKMPVKPEPEPITPFTIIRGSHCHGTTGQIGADAAQRVIEALDAAGYIILEKSSFQGKELTNG